MSLLFKMLFRFLIAFLPRSKRLLISWLKASKFYNQKAQNVTMVTII